MKVLSLLKSAKKCCINWFAEKINKEKDNDPFARGEAYIEYRKKFPYYPDKHKEDEK